MAERRKKIKKEETRPLSVRKIRNYGQGRAINQD